MQVLFEKIKKKKKKDCMKISKKKRYNNRSSICCLIKSDAKLLNIDKIQLCYFAFKIDILRKN